MLSIAHTSDVLVVSPHISHVFLPFDLALVETMPTASPVADTLAEAWDVVKDRPNHSNRSRTFDAVEQTDLGDSEAVKEGIGNLFEGISIFMTFLDLAAESHPVIHVVVVAFKTAYTLEQKRRDNEKKIPALYAEMMDMMSVCFPSKMCEMTSSSHPTEETSRTRIA